MVAIRDREQLFNHLEDQIIRHRAYYEVTEDVLENGMTGWCTMSDWELVEWTISHDLDLILPQLGDVVEGVYLLRSGTSNPVDRNRRVLCQNFLKTLDHGPEDERPVVGYYLKDPCLVLYRSSKDHMQLAHLSDPVDGQSGQVLSLDDWSHRVCDQRQVILLDQAHVPGSSTR